MTWRNLLLVLAATLIGILGGAAWAAPGEIQAAAQALLAWGTRQAGAITPRDLAMAVAALALIASATAALVLHRRASRPAPARRPDARLPRGAATPMPMGPPRRRPARAVSTTQVRAMASHGTSPLEISRTTGLPLDAVSLVLAVSAPERNLTAGAARSAG
jgi:hypothetical protein